MDFLILSKCRSNGKGVAHWWRERGRGYTTDVDQAGRYSAEESLRIVRGSPEKDMRVPVSAIGRLIETRRVVSLEDANNLEELRAFDG